MVHSKWTAILPVTARVPGSFKPGLLYGYDVAVLPQFLLGVAYFSFSYCKGCAHLLTFSSLSFQPPPPPPPKRDTLPGRLSNLGISTCRTQLVSPVLPSGSVRGVAQKALIAEMIGNRVVQTKKYGQSEKENQGEKKKTTTKYTRRTRKDKIKGLVICLPCMADGSYNSVRPNCSKIIFWTSFFFFFFMTVGHTGW